MVGIDSRKDPTVVLAGWLPDSSGKVCFALPSHPCSSNDLQPLCLFVFSSVYLQLSVASHHFLVNIGLNIHWVLDEVVSHVFLEHTNQFPLNRSGWT